MSGGFGQIWIIETKVGISTQRNFHSVNIYFQSGLGQNVTFLGKGKESHECFSQKC